LGFDEADVALLIEGQGRTLYSGAFDMTSSSSPQWEVTFSKGCVDYGEVWKGETDTVIKSLEIIKSKVADLYKGFR
jgi:hypothetical protein